MNADEKKILRKKLYVNPEIQGAILLRSVLHWSFYVCAILLVVVIWTAIRDPSQNALKLVFESFVYFSPAIVAGIILLPLFVYDVLKATHRFAGPIIRLQREMAKLMDGEEIEHVRFRDGDYWNILAEDFNALSDRVKEERRAHREFREASTRQHETVVG